MRGMMSQKSKGKNPLTHLFHSKKKEIDTWFDTHPANTQPLVYASVDIRDAGFKTAIVDKNLFPAGFNNLCSKSQAISGQKFRSFFDQLDPHASKIGLIAEDHTRNEFYLQNISVLKKILEQAGYYVEVRMNVTTRTTIALNGETSGNLNIYPYSNPEKMDILLLNNDLSSGIPKDLNIANSKMVPSPKIGWHRRKKSHHFTLANKIIHEFSSYIDCDPWLMSCLFDTASEINIHEKTDRDTLADKSAILLNKIQQKYNAYDIKEKPFIFIKCFLVDKEIFELFG